MLRSRFPVDGVPKAGLATERSREEGFRAEGVLENYCDFPQPFSRTAMTLVVVDLLVLTYIIVVFHSRVISPHNTAVRRSVAGLRFILSVRRRIN